MPELFVHLQTRADRNAARAPATAPSAPGATASPAGPDSGDPAGRYLGAVRMLAAQPTSEPAAGQANRGADEGAVTSLREFARRIVQTCRLVVGIHDYEQYLDHMRLHHPDATPLTRKAFYRYCLEARYPGGGRGGTGCPC